MKTVKVSGLSGAALDWAVGTSTRTPISTTPYFSSKASGDHGHGICCWADVTQRPWRPTIDWGQCGPLIDAYGVKVGPVYWPFDSAGHQWFAVTSNDSKAVTERGETALIAACRAIVAAKLGSEIEVPEELL